jgi:hypothetical protein
VTIVILAILSSAYADSFQIVDRTGGYYLNYSPVYEGTVLLGHTDKYGRILIEKPSGTYLLTVVYQGASRQVGINVNGSGVLKIVNPN